MTPRSAKAKGRRLQNWVRDRILALYPSLKSQDVKPAIMGERGEDIKLSTEAAKLFPYSVECKSVDKAYKAVYDAYAQALASCNLRGSLVTGKKTLIEPLVVLKRNRMRPLVVMDADHFFELLSVKDTYK